MLSDHRVVLAKDHLLLQSWLAYCVEEPSARRAHQSHDNHSVLLEHVYCSEHNVVRLIPRLPLGHGWLAVTAAL